MSTDRTPTLANLFQEGKIIQRSSLAAKPAGLRRSKSTQPPNYNLKATPQSPSLFEVGGCAGTRLSEDPLNRGIFTLLPGVLLGLHYTHLLDLEVLRLRCAGSLGILKKNCRYTTTHIYINTHTHIYIYMNPAGPTRKQDNDKRSLLFTWRCSRHESNHEPSLRY